MNKKTLALIVALTVSGAQIRADDVAEAVEQTPVSVESETAAEVTSSENEVKKADALPELPELTEEEAAELEKMLTELIQAQKQQQEQAAQK